MAPSQANSHLQIHDVLTDAQIGECWEAFAQLRPHLDRSSFVELVRLQHQDGYRIVALYDDAVACCVAGYRITHFLAWGRVLYLDDLSTIESARNRGYAGRLLEVLKTRAQDAGCRSIHLDTGYARHVAHRLYLRHGFVASCHHFACDLVGEA